MGTSKIGHTPRSPKVRTLEDLPPTEFENLIFDLMVSRGMTNVCWRTPGADGGRDIEGITTETDLSGAQVTRRWFIECKRYASSVDWPTIYSKLSYADSHQANFLLLCTTSKFSPAAITQVDAWNSSHRAVAIRLWPKHELDLQLRQHPDLLLKYRLSSAPSTPGRSILALALALSKTVSSHYSRLVFEDGEPDLMLQAAQAFSDLLTRRMDDMERGGGIALTFPHALQTTQPLAGCTFRVDSLQIDETGLRAFVAYLAALCNESIDIQANTDASSCKITSSANLAEIVSRYAATFGAIATWADFEFDASTSGIRIRQRV